MVGARNLRRSAYQTTAASVFFFLAAALGKQVSFVGVGVAFLAIGASQLRRQKSAGDGDTPA